MENLEMSRVDEVVLAWLVLPRKKPSTAALASAIKPLFGGSVDDAKKHANDALGRLKAGGMIERDTRLMLNAEGRRRALAILGVTDLPKRGKVDWTWAKKLLVLRAVDLPITPATIEKSGKAAWLAKRVLIEHYQLSLKDDASLTDIIAALVGKALGRDGRDPVPLKHLKDLLLLRGTPAPATVPSIEAPAVTPATPATNGLPGFAASVRKAAKASPTGRWHDNKVFISHVWNELQRQGATGAMTFPDFQGQLIEANRAKLIELSRADLVQAMPREDVAASETPYLNASYHFVRLDDR